MSTMSSREWGLLLTLSVLWGGSFFFAAVALQSLSPLSVVFGRVAIAALVLIGVLAILRIPLPRDRAVWAALAGMAVLNNLIPFTLIFWGQTAMASGLAAILNATTPLFTVVVLHFFTPDERATPQKVAGVLIGLAGVVVLLGPSVVGALDTPVWALGAGLGAALSYGFAGLWGRRFKALGVPPMVTAWGQVTCTSLMMLPVVLLFDQPWLRAPPSALSLAALTGLAVISTALAYVIFFRLLASAGPSNLLLVTFLIPVTAILLGVTILGERLAITHVLGMVLIGGGLAAIDGRLWARLTRRP